MSIVPWVEADMIIQSERSAITVRDVAVRPAAREGAGLIVLWLESPRLPGMLPLFGVAAAWFVFIEPVRRARRAP